MMIDQRFGLALLDLVAGNVIPATTTTTTVVVEQSQSGARTHLKRTNYCQATEPSGLIEYPMVRVHSSCFDYNCCEGNKHEQK